MKEFAVLLALCDVAQLAAAEPTPAGPDDSLGSAGPNRGDLDDLFAMSVGLYRQDDHGGNPHVDERAAVYEGIVFIQQGLGAHDAVAVNLLGDVITAASYDRFKDKAISSGATGFNPGHLQGELAWHHRRDDWGVSAGGTYGQEFAYKTQGLSLSGDRSFNEDNTRLSARLRYYDDQVRNIRFDGFWLDNQRRITTSYGLSLTQLISRDTLADLAIDWTRQRGLLATSFNSVFVSGAEVPEAAPDRRNRFAATLRGKWAPDERQSWEVGVRGYGDDWGIRSFTAELKWFHYLAQRSVLAEPSLRFYRQSAADFYATDFAAGQPYMTSDSDLGHFNSYQAALTATWLSPSWIGGGSSFSAAVAGSYRDDGLLMAWTVFGVIVPM